MGAVNVDLNKRERLYDARYPLDNPYGVRHIFEDYHRLWESVWQRSDLDALNVILDFMDALEDANLTTKQREALYYVFILKMTQEDAAGELNIDQSKISTRVDRALLRIAESQGYNEEVFIEKHGH